MGNCKKSSGKISSAFFGQCFAQSLEPLRDPNVFSSAPWEPFPPGCWPLAVPAPGSSQSPQTKWSRSTTKDPGAPAAWAEAETGTSPPGAVGFFENRDGIFFGILRGVVKGYTHRYIYISYWLIDWLVGWLVGWLIGWLVDWLIGWLVGWLIDWLVGWLIDWLVDLLIGWLVDWLIGWFIDWLVGWGSSWDIEQQWGVQQQWGT